MSITTCPICARPTHECPGCENDTYCGFCRQCALPCEWQLDRNRIERDRYTAKAKDH